MQSIGTLLLLPAIFILLFLARLAIQSLGSTKDRETRSLVGHQAEYSRRILRRYGVRLSMAAAGLLLVAFILM